MKTIEMNGRKLLVVAECPNTASTLERFGSRYKLAVWSKNGGVLLHGANLSREQVMGWNDECAAAARALSNPVALVTGRNSEGHFALRAESERCVVVKKAAPKKNRLSVCAPVVRLGLALRAAVMAYRIQRAKRLRQSAKALKVAVEKSNRTLRSNGKLTHTPFAALLEVVR